MFADFIKFRDKTSLCILNRTLIIAAWITDTDTDKSLSVYITNETFDYSFNTTEEAEAVLEKLFIGNV